MWPVSEGWPQKLSARSISFAALFGSFALSLSSTFGRIAYEAIAQRARYVAVSSQRVSSQPATFGG